MLVGEIEFGSFQNDRIESDDRVESGDRKKFKCTNKDNKQFVMQTKGLKDWALLLNSPWSQNTFGYDIELNCKDGFTEMNKDDPQWRCRYYTIGYDGITASCIGYGNTEEEALKNCKNLFNYLEKEYNKDGDSI